MFAPKCRRIITYRGNVTVDILIHNIHSNLNLVHNMYCTSGNKNTELLIKLQSIHLNYSAGQGPPENDREK